MAFRICLRRTGALSTLRNSCVAKGLRCAAPLSALTGGAEARSDVLVPALVRSAIKDRGARIDVVVS